MNLLNILVDGVTHFGESFLDVVGGGITWVLGMGASLLLLITAALPDGGFIELPEVVGMWESGIAWLNWLVPVGQLGALLAAWLAATVAYYVFQLKLRAVIFGNK